MLQALMQTVDVMDAWELLQSMAPMSYDSSRLIDVACIGFSNVTPEYLSSLTDIYKERVDKEREISAGMYRLGTPDYFVFRSSLANIARAFSRNDLGGSGKKDSHDEATEALDSTVDRSTVLLDSMESNHHAAKPIQAFWASNQVQWLQMIFQLGV